MRVEAGNGVLKLPGQCDRVDIGLLLDRDDNGGLGHVAAVAAPDLGRVVDACHLPQIDRLALDLGDHDVAQVVEAGGAADVADQVLARMQVGKPASGVGAELRQRPIHVLVGDAKGAQRRRVRRDAILPHLAAHRNDLGYARNAQEPGPDREVRDFAQLHRRGLVAGQGDHQHLAHDRTDRPHVRRDIRRQLIADETEALRDQLTIAVDVGAPIELDIDDRQADA